MTPIVIVVPGQPVGKGRPRVTRTGHAYTPRKTADHEETVAAYAAMAMRGNAPYEHAISLTITAFFEIPASWTKAKTERALDGSFRVAPVDLDNVAKLAMDALNKIVWHDDKQVVQLTATKGYAREPKTIIRVEPALPADA